jgi:hypothetical protein
MAHWAEIDENNKVIRVLVTSNDEPDEGYQWLIDNLGGTWIQTSYNSLGGVHYSQECDAQNNRIPSGKPHVRYNFASIGMLYDPIRDAFIPIKPDFFGNWILDENTLVWKRV